MIVNGGSMHDDSLMAYNFRDAMVGLSVRKIGRLFYVEGVEESKEDGLTKRQLYILLHKLIGTHAEEIAFMLLEFKDNPEFSQAFFGINGFFLYAK